MTFPDPKAWPIIGAGPGADGDGPLRRIAGEDAVERIETVARHLLAQIDAHRKLSTDLTHDDARVVA